jgi:4-oxalocrotonate tautomerase|tara:strand:+ start:16351 stop:16542 length:192 start_codon:yes stop_codon:yes gene_type:complete
MPIATINIIEGRDDAKKEALIEKVTLAIYESLGAPIETIRVIINEMPKQHYGIAGNSAKKLGK